MTGTGPRLRTAAAVAGVALLLALPVGGQETEAPRSLLPPDAEAAPATPAIDPAVAPTGDVAPLLPVFAPPGAATEDSPDAFGTAAASGGDISVAGPLREGGVGGGYGLQTFGGSNGRLLIGLMQRMNAPVASRWAHILLRRALLSQSAAPDGVNPADWVAARASLLIRMGEIDGAKLLVDAVPVDRFSPALYRVAGYAAYAAADIGAVCPLAETGAALTRDPIWQLSIAMCSAMQGDDLTAAQVFDELRSDNRVDAFDIRLGERVATLAGGGGRATNIAWDEAPVLTPYRWGVATAAGVPVPADKLATLGPARFGWLVRAAPVGADIRSVALRPAAVIGVLSGDDLVSAVAAAAAGQGDDAIAGTPAGRLRRAFAAASAADRLTALRAIWGTGNDGVSRYAALIESAPAVLRIAPSDAASNDVASMIAALLAVGAEPAAGRWRVVAQNGSSAAKAQAWALLAVSAGGVAIDRAAFKTWRSDAGPDATPHRAALLLAGLTGLDRARGSDWDTLRGELLPETANSWTRAIDVAAAAGRTGEVIVLAATALQGSWRDVPPAHLRHLVAALSRVGRGHEARMIVAEAVTRG